MSKRNLKHLGIIMDGNRRWAKKAGLPVIEGHRQGFKVLKELLRTVNKLDIEYLSVYAFSTENWERSSDEVEGIMKILKWVVKVQLDEIISEGIRVVWVGSRDKLSDDVINMMDKVEAKTKDLTAGTLAVCFNYGGQQEIIDAAAAAAGQGEVTKESIEANLYSPDLPPLDLIIRTSGEQRLSNFMLWRAAYSEFAFTQTLWPDFNGEELAEIVNEYKDRSRRFGA